MDSFPDGDTLYLKDALEDAIHAVPADTALRTRYFDVLDAISATHHGPCAVRLPGIAHAIRIRCGTDDAAILRGIFLDDWYGIPLPAAPKHILDLGAHAGFAAIYLANRFPDAEILCVEADTSHYRSLLMNTLPYSKIAHLHGAAAAGGGWAQPADPRARGAWKRFTITGDTVSIGGHGQSSAPPRPGQVRAYDITQALQFCGWPHADLIKCSLSGEEAALFTAASASAAWLGAVKSLLISSRTPEAPFQIQHALEAAHPFEIMAHGAVTVLRRSGAEETEPATAGRVSLLETELFRPVAWEGTEQALTGSGFTEEHAVLMQAAAPGDLPTSLTIRLDFDGQTRLRSGITSVGQPGSIAQFTLAIQRVADQATLFSTAVRVPAGQQALWSTRCPLLSGPHDVVFQVETAPDSPPGLMAALHWQDPAASAS